MTLSKEEENLLNEIQINIATLSILDLDSLHAQIDWEFRENAPKTWDESKKALDLMGRPQNGYPDLDHPDSVNYRREVVFVRVVAELLRRRSGEFSGGSRNPFKRRTARKWLLKLIDLY